ncbi:hypothetical protein J5N97_013178 [Dioscorea zingiberensis]|uniref:Uncharacterized protein n=1 Tax=Dioscorea zingiberensis TaxID=325984 RepID=A0A9D5HII4_9LILI|nr:hypothetical protein J5N97_013178 [Dioscorea zingiberensis]
MESLLSVGFMDKTKEKGMVVRWSTQDKVLVYCMVRGPVEPKDMAGKGDHRGGGEVRGGGGRREGRGEDKEESGGVEYDGEGGDAARRVIL